MRTAARTGSSLAGSWSMDCAVASKWPNVGSIGDDDTAAWLLSCDPAGVGAAMIASGAARAVASSHRRAANRLITIGKDFADTLGMMVL
jgi:hypothetical protein